MINNDHDPSDFPDFEDPKNIPEKTPKKFQEKSKKRDNQKETIFSVIEKIEKLAEIEFQSGREILDQNEFNKYQKSIDESLIG